MERRAGQGDRMAWRRGALGFLIPLSSLCSLCLCGSHLLGDEKGATFEDVLKDMLATMDQITSTLGEVKDEETAKAARPGLQKAAQRFVELRKKADTVKPPSKEEKDRLDKEY